MGVIALGVPRLGGCIAAVRATVLVVFSESEFIKMTYLKSSVCDRLTFPSAWRVTLLTAKENSISRYLELTMSQALL